MSDGPTQNEIREALAAHEIASVSYDPTARDGSGAMKAACICGHIGALERRANHLSARVWAAVSG